MALLVVVIYMRDIYNRVDIYNRRTQPSATPKLHHTGKNAAPRNHMHAKGGVRGTGVRSRGAMRA